MISLNRGNPNTQRWLQTANSLKKTSLLPLLPAFIPPSLSSLLSTHSLSFPLFLDSNALELMKIKYFFSWEKSGGNIKKNKAGELAHTLKGRLTTKYIFKKTHNFLFEAHLYNFIPLHSLPHET